MTFAEFLSNAFAYYFDHDDMRVGQSLFNYLCFTRPDLSTRVVGAEGLDPYYDDENLNGFLDFVARNW